MSDQSKSAAAIDRDEGRAALIGYLPAGYPGRAATSTRQVALARRGCDVIEIGIPYSDPVMDGTDHRRDHRGALRGGVRVRARFAPSRRSATPAAAPW